MHGPKVWNNVPSRHASPWCYVVSTMRAPTALADRPWSRRILDLQQILAHDDRPAKVCSGRVDPHLIGDGQIVRRHEVREYERPDACSLCHAAGVLGSGVMRQNARLQCARVRNFTDETINPVRIQYLVDEN